MHLRCNTLHFVICRFLYRSLLGRVVAWVVLRMEMLSFYRVHVFHCE
jgi:hypothetical protein